MEVRVFMQMINTRYPYIPLQIQALGRKSNTKQFMTYPVAATPIDGEDEQLELPPLNSISLSEEQDDVDSERMALYDIRMTMPNTVVSTYQCTKADIQLIRLLAAFGGSSLRGHRRELFDARARRLLDRHVREG